MPRGMLTHHLRSENHEVAPFAARRAAPVSNVRARRIVLAVLRRTR